MQTEPKPNNDIVTIPNSPITSTKYVPELVTGSPQIVKTLVSANAVRFRTPLQKGYTFVNAPEGYPRIQIVEAPSAEERESICVTRKEGGEWITECDTMFPTTARQCVKAGWDCVELRYSLEGILVGGRFSVKGQKLSIRSATASEQEEDEEEK